MCMQNSFQMMRWATARESGPWLASVCRIAGTWFVKRSNNMIHGVDLGSMEDRSWNAPFWRTRRLVASIPWFWPAQDIPTSRVPLTLNSLVGSSRNAQNGRCFVALLKTNDMVNTRGESLTYFFFHAWKTWAGKTDLFVVIAKWLVENNQTFRGERNLDTDIPCTTDLTRRRIQKLRAWA